MSGLDSVIIDFYKEAEAREQRYIAMIAKLELENLKMKQENEKLRGEIENAKNKNKKNRR